MLEFDMPPEDDKERYERFDEALKKAGIAFGKTFHLDIEEGRILNLAKKKISFDSKRMSFGCVANPPQFSYWTINDGLQVMYKRKLHSYAKKEGFFIDGIPDIPEITKAFSRAQDYYEIFSLEKSAPERAKIKIFSDDEKWKFTFNGRESVRNREEDGENIRYAVDIMLDFYRPNNL